MKRVGALMLAVLVLISAWAPAQANFADQFYQTVSPMWFAFQQYQEWKESHPNTDESEYSGYRPNGTFGAGRHGAGFSQADFDEEYAAFLGELPAQSITSAGRLIWQPAFADLVKGTGYYTSPSSGVGYYLVDPEDVSANASGNGFVGSTSSVSSLSKLCCFVEVSNYPVSGSYRCLDTCALNARILRKNAVEVEFVSVNYSLSSWSHCTSSSVKRFNSERCNSSMSSVIYIAFEGFCPVFEVIPDSAIDFSSAGTTYNINSRPTSISGGNYGIVGDNGQITTVTDNSSIVNEGDNIYYNPATGETGTIQDWSYDYSNRTYTLTLAGGDTTTGDTSTVTVTYGDENITIREGDTNYTIYYVVENTENPPCTHSWGETGTTAASCNQAGSKEFTCTLCGQTKRETIPALGHDWKVKRTVTTQYDESGNLVQEGYTLYECSRCGEQYKSTSGSSPPGGTEQPGDDGDKSIWELLSEYILNGLSAVIGTVLAMFDQIPQLFTGFLAFLSAVFPFLPDEIITLLTFGIAAVVFIGIIKAVRR